MTPSISKHSSSVTRRAGIYFGASVAGPRHCAERKPNEDCWLGAKRAFGTLIVVSDGMGSRSEARRGSRMACRAVLDAVSAWHKESAKTFDDLLSSIEPRWLDLIAPASARDCAATCLFALMHTNGNLYVAGIGDGMALTQHHGSLTWTIGPRTSDFGNETKALGSGASWTRRDLQSPSGNVVVLATDGVADDLVTERIPGFVQWLVEVFAVLQPYPRWRALENELKNWPTPRHTDDKTIAILIQP